MFELFELIKGVMKFAAVVMGVGIGIPVAIQTGNGKAAAITIVVVLVWLILKIVFGDDEAEDYLEDVKSKSKNGKNSR